MRNPSARHSSRRLMKRHMALPAIGQSQVIADQLDILVRTYAPSSVAILGCAGGNGFERLIDTSVSRVVGIDINPQANNRRGTAARREGRVPGLKLVVGDIQTSAWRFEPVDFIYAALVFEYVDVARTMSALRRHCTPNGILAGRHRRCPTWPCLKFLPPRTPVCDCWRRECIFCRTKNCNGTQCKWDSRRKTPERFLSPGGKQFIVETFRLCLKTPVGRGAV